MKKGRTPNFRSLPNFRLKWLLYKSGFYLNTRNLFHRGLRTDRIGPYLDTVEGIDESHRTRHYDIGVRSSSGQLHSVLIDSNTNLALCICPSGDGFNHVGSKFAVDTGHVTDGI